MGKKRDKADKHTKAYQVLSRLQKELVKRLAGHVLENEAGLRQAGEGAEGYGFPLHQLDEIFLSRLNLIERAMAELQKAPAQGTNRYRSMVFTSSRDEVERKINSRLAKVPGARVLGVTVSPMSAPSRVTYQFGEIAHHGSESGKGGSEGGVGGSPESVSKLVKSAVRSDAEEDLGPGDIIEDISETPHEDDEDDELLVTVLYYGPATASDA